MIVSQVIGGLGNQIFQYAAGRATALKRSVPLRLDVSGFASYGLYQGFELSKVFNLVTDIATQEDIKSILGCRADKTLRRVLTHPVAARLRGRHYIVEPYFHYWPEIANVPRDCYLVGYWQSEKYFQDIAPVIRADFTFKHPLKNLNAEIARKIGQVSAVSLHVRRGDYAGNPKTTATHGLCSLEYYQQAIQYVLDRVGQPYFFIFSDDIAWAKENLKVDIPCHYVNHNRGAASYIDMQLMSLCQHHIIANSSFSWWGAWLNPSPDKIVFAPRKWFANDNDVNDLIPQGWVTL